jgi:hypothetical protein
LLCTICTEVDEADVDVGHRVEVVGPHVAERSPLAARL